MTIAEERKRLYMQPPTFMNLPFSADGRGAGAAILGCPFDCGIHPFRIGSRQGPRAIREQSGLVPRHSPTAPGDPLADLSAVDAGDVVLVPSRMEEALAAMEEAAWRLADAGAAPVGFGGDGIVSLPLVRAAARVHPDLAVLHVDSHTDAYPVDSAYPYDPSVQFTHAALEQRIRTGASWHVGLRGSTSRAGVWEHARDLGYQLLSMRDIEERGPLAVAADLRGALAGRPVYLSWDMDVFDPSVAPGVCTPVWGGWTAREGLGFLRALAGLDIVAADVNTVSPPHDVGGATAFLAAQVTYDILLLIRQARAARTAAQPGPGGAG